MYIDHDWALKCPNRLLWLFHFAYSFVLIRNFLETTLKSSNRITVVHWDCLQICERDSIKRNNSIKLPETYKNNARAKTAKQKKAEKQNVLV